MHVLEIETFGRGGLTHYAFNLSSALAARGHRVTFVTSHAYELRDRGAPEGLEVREVIAPWSSTPPGWMRGLALNLVRKAETILDALRIGLLARRARPDVVHLHCTNPAVLLYLWCLKLARCPVVATAHVVTPHERIPLQGFVYGRVHRASDLVVAHSEVDRQRLLTEFGIAPDRVVVLPHGDYGFFEDEPAAGEESGDGPEQQARRRAEARAWLGLAPDAEVALFFGFVREYKGLDLLLEAWEAVARERPNARLLIAGDPVNLAPERRAELEAWATRLDAVHRFGYIPFDDVPRYFAAADVLVMPYRHISQSGVLFLALSLGLPVLATRVGALPSMLVDGESGLLVEPGTAAPLVPALTRILGDPGLASRIALGGRRVARDHAWPAIAERTATAFQSLRS